MASQNRIKKIYSEISDTELINHKHLLNRIANSLVDNYVWSAEIKPLAYDLINYFSGLDGRYDLNKSIAIIGSYGIGKSVLMKIFKLYMNSLPGLQYNHPNVFRIISIEDVISCMSGDNPLNSDLLYNQKAELDRPVKKPVHILINEFGYKYNGKSYGTDFQELIEMFIMKRYDIFQDYGKLTHVTMNYGASELEEVFDKKIIDRFIEMLNMIPIKGDSFRK